MEGVSWIILIMGLIIVGGMIAGILLVNWQPSPIAQYRKLTKKMRKLLAGEIQLSDAKIFDLGVDIMIYNKECTKMGLIGEEEVTKNFELLDKLFELIKDFDALQVPDEIKAAWQDETDEWVLKAAIDNINKYTPEIRIIIRNEAVKRGLINYKISKAGPNGLEFEALTTKKGKFTLEEGVEKDTKVFITKSTKSIFILTTIALISLLIGSMWGLKISKK
ncbi:MAG: hypothetical protein JXB29_04495 [Sedimentisphaerales bacterium]|nr:hypothetical protein [Sedimentisphaerales bacterium]